MQTQKTDVTKPSENFGANVRRALIKKERSAGWLAKKTGITHARIREIFDGEDPAIDESVRICNVLDVSLSAMCKSDT